MNQSQLRGDLPEPVRRYFLEVAQMHPPADLLDTAMAEIERTPRANRFAALPILGFAATAAAVIGLLVYTLMTPAVPDIGEEPDPSPSASERASSPAPVPIATLPPLESLPSAGSIVATYDVGTAGVPVLYAHGSLWLSNAETGALTRMDPDTGVLGASVEVNPNPETTRYDLNAVADDRWVWATGIDDTIVKIDPQTNEIVERIDVGTMAYRLVLHEGQVWITDLDQGGHLIALDTTTGKVVVDELHAFWPAALAVTGTDVWMAPYQDARLHRIDPATGQSFETFPVWSNSMQIAPLGDSLYITGNQERPLERFSLVDGAVVARMPEMNVAVDGGRLFGIRYDGTIMELDPATLQPRSALVLEGGETAFGVFAGGRLYIAQGEGEVRIVVFDPVD